VGKIGLVGQHLFAKQTLGEFRDNAGFTPWGYKRQGDNIFPFDLLGAVAKPIEYPVITGNYIPLYIEKYYGFG
jgi:hypothetical protein